MLLSNVRRTLVAAIVGVMVATGTVRAATLPFSIGQDQGVFLHVSDIHFDPLADPALGPRLIAAPVEQWQDIFRSSAQMRLSPYGQDTNFPLLMSMLAAAKGVPYDYVLNTGDNLAHQFRRRFLAAGGDAGGYEAFVTKTMLFVDRLLKESFPGIPLISALGNNDAACGDYMLTPDSPMLAPLGRDLPAVAASPEALRDFATGGFYATPHPTVARHDIIVLSDVFWSAHYRAGCKPNGADAGSAELAWLEWTLYREKLEGRSVSLVMHIPPGIDAYGSSRSACPGSIVSFWKEAYTNRFLALVGAYKDIIRGSYAGHTHMDDFRVLPDGSGTPVLTMRMAPAVSPIYNNNPAFTVLLYDKADASVTDYATFYLANLDQTGPGVAPDWRFGYAFTRTYGARTYDPAQLSALANRIRSEPSVRASYLQHYAVETASQSPINAANWKAYACAQTAITPADYAACACPGRDAAPERPKSAP